MESIVPFSKLKISAAEISESMGYGSSVPDNEVLAEIDVMMSEIERICVPRFSFFVVKGEVDRENNSLGINGNQFGIGKIIARQLNGSEAFAIFTATAGNEFEDFQQRLQSEGDMVRIFITNSIGSIIAEKAADAMEEALQAFIDKTGWKHTNRFSPGYCGWHVSEQQRLFSLFPTANPCGIRLTDSSLMIPIKSVSGIIGIGKNVRHLDYSCGLCDYSKCYKKRRRNNATE